MMYVKRIACLANSWKIGGACVAGKEIIGNAWGEWIRPVSVRPAGELSQEERHYENGQDPEVGDIVDIPLTEPRPSTYQRENHVIDYRRHWKRVDRCTWDQLQAAVDTVDGPLWENGHSSSRGVDDCVPEESAAKLEHSLCLVRPVDLHLTVRPEWEGKRRVRGEFSLNGLRYRLKVTDPVAVSHCLGRPDGTHRIENAIICLSLGEIFRGHAYKLIAALITPSRLEGRGL
jgi:hypothetical protein